MLHCSVTRQPGLALLKVKIGLVSERVNRANPDFFVCVRVSKISNSPVAKIFHFSNPLSNCQESGLFVLVKKYSFFTFPEVRLGMSLIQTATVPHNTNLSNFLVNKNTCFMVFFLFEGPNEYP